MAIYTRLTKETIARSVSDSSKAITILSAYCKYNAFESISKISNPKIPRKLITRWQFRDLVSGASDLEVYELARDRGWKFYFHQHLHAKVYCFDDLSIVGSSNLTHRGLGGYAPEGNVELSVQFNVNEELRAWIDRIEQEAFLVDDQLYNVIANEVIDSRKSTPLPPTRKGFSEKVLSILNLRKVTANLFLYDLPQCKSFKILVSGLESSFPDLVVHDLNVLGLHPGVEIGEIKAAFARSPGYSWLDSVLTKPRSFGELSKLLHDQIKDEPPAYRREVKNRLSNLIGWTIELFPDSYRIETQRHRHVLHKV